MSPAAVGFVVAGGASRRMGRDKALLPWGAEPTLLDHALRRLRAVCDEVRILSGAAPRYAGRGVPVDLDAWPEAGPLGGLLAGVERLDERPGLFLAVDVPRVPVSLLAHLVASAAAWDAVVPAPAAGPEPLCAVYRRSCAEPIRRRLAAGERRLTCFWPDVRVRLIEEADLRPFGDPALLFANLNTPEEYQQQQQQQPTSNGPGGCGGADHRPPHTQ